nr:immunoglobulin light chain junction region [Macaca mulatta]
CQQYSKWPTF